MKNCEVETLYLSNVYILTSTKPFVRVFTTQEDSEVISEEDGCLTQDEIQAFVEQNQSFYNNRHQYRQLLKEKFTNYCRATEQSKPVCRKWFATTSVQ